MTIGTKTLVTNVNNNISTATSPLEILQLASVAKDFGPDIVTSVANCAALPSAATNKGRLFYLEDRCSYRWSDGTTWSSDFTTVLEPNVYSWGRAGFGQLGDNTTVSKSSPVSVIGGFTDWCQVSAKNDNSLGLRSNGTLWAWGSGVQGRLGDDTTVSKSSPVSVVGGFTDWCQASAGSNHSLAVRTNGTLWAWGSNSSGVLGDNETVSRSSPVSVVGGFTDWCQASAGNDHSLAVRQNGTLWAWGNGTQGQLGDNTASSKCVPVAVVGGFTDWCQASAGVDTHSLAVRQNGTLWAWGDNDSGRLGDNTVVPKSSPVLVAGGFADWCQASAGSSHNLALRASRGF